MGLPTPPRPVSSDALPLLGRDGKPIPSVGGGGDSQMKDGEDNLVVNRHSSSEILADASPESVVGNTAGARGVASIAAAPRENVAPITAAPNGNIAPIAVTSKDIVSFSLSRGTKSEEATASADRRFIGCGRKSACCLDFWIDVFAAAAAN